MSFMMEGKSLDDGAPGVAFLVLTVDVQAAWDLSQQSMHTLKHFKVTLIHLPYYLSEVVNS